MAPSSPGRLRAWLTRFRYSLTATRSSGRSIIGHDLQPLRVLRSAPEPSGLTDRTVTVEADSGGKTRILFSGREAPGDFGRCVGEVAARTKIADGERLSGKL